MEGLTCIVRAAAAGGIERDLTGHELAAPERGGSQEGINQRSPQGRSASDKREAVNDQSRLDP